MGSIIPIGRIVRNIYSSASPTVTRVAATTPVSSGSSAATSNAGNSAGSGGASSGSGSAGGAAASDTAPQDLGIGSTILTSLRGLLNLNKFAPQRKSLLGE